MTCTTDGQHCRVSWTLKSDKFVEYFKDIEQDMDPLTPVQQEIADKVSSLHNCHQHSCNAQYVTPERVSDIIL